MIRTLSKAVVMLIASTSATQRPGLGGSITAEGITNAKNIAVPFIFQNLKNMTISEIDISGGSFKNLEIQVPAPSSLSDITMELDGANNGVGFTAKNVMATVLSDFSFTYFITVTGKAKIVVKDVGVDAEIGLGTQTGTYGELAPKLNVLKSAINIDSSNIDVTLTGGLVAKIANLLVPLVKSSVVPSIVSTIQDTIKQTVDVTINADLVKYGNEVELPYFGGVTFDYAEFLGGPKVQSDNSYIQAAVNGTFFDAQAPETYSTQATPFPLRNPTGKSLQAYATEYTVNSALKSGYDTGNTLNITHLLYQFLNLTLTTDNMAYVVPEILTVYGSGKAVSIAGKLCDPNAFAKVTPTLASITGCLEGTISVEGSDAITGRMDNMLAAAFINMKNGLVLGSFSKHSMGTVSNFKTSLGLTAAQFQTNVQAVIEYWTGVINTDLATGITISPILGADVKDMELNYSNGFLEFGLNATPYTFEIIQNAWVAYKNHVDAIRAGEFKTTKYVAGEFNTFLQ